MSSTLNGTFCLKDILRIFFKPKKPFGGILLNPTQMKNPFQSCVSFSTHTWRLTDLTVASVAQQISMGQQTIQLMDFHLGTSALGIVFHLLSMRMALPSASTSQLLQVRRCCSDPHILGDPGEKVHTVYLHTQSNLRQLEEEKVWVLRVGGAGGTG